MADSTFLLFIAVACCLWVVMIVWKDGGPRA